MSQMLCFGTNYKSNTHTHTHTQPLVKKFFLEFIQQKIQTVSTKEYAYSSTWHDMFGVAKIREIQMPKKKYELNFGSVILLHNCLEEGPNWILTHLL